MELLVRLTDSGVDKAGSIKPGMVIDIRPDGYQWGRKESIDEWIRQGNKRSDWHGHTAIIKIPGENPDDYKSLLDVDSIVPAITNEPEIHINSKRKSKLDIKKFRNIGGDFKIIIEKNDLLGAVI